MDPLCHGAIRFWHPGDRREHVAFPLRLVLLGAGFRLQLFGASLHRGHFLGRESSGLIFARGGAPSRLLAFLLWAHNNLLILIWVRNFAPLGGRMFLVNYLRGRITSEI